MKVEELRIGNYYAIALEEGIAYKRVKELCVNEFGNYSSEGHNLELAAKPIPLTEDKLLSLGFTTYKDYGEFEKGIIELKYCVEGCWSLYYYKHQISTEIEYVHQLQNLYYELTGEELKLK